MRPSPPRTVTRELAEATFKGHGHHRLLAACDNTGEPLAWMLRPGSAGSNTAAYHLRLLREAIGAVPPGAATQDHSDLRQDRRPQTHRRPLTCAQLSIISWVSFRISSGEPLQQRSPPPADAHRAVAGSSVVVMSRAVRTADAEPRPSGRIPRDATSLTARRHGRPPATWRSGSSACVSPGVFWVSDSDHSMRTSVPHAPRPRTCPDFGA
jgi:hypothetical protein